MTGDAHHAYDLEMNKKIIIVGVYFPSQKKEVYLLLSLVHI